MGIESLATGLFGDAARRKANKAAKRQVQQGYRDQLSLAAPDLQLRRNAVAALSQALGLPPLELDAILYGNQQTSPLDFTGTGIPGFGTSRRSPGASDPLVRALGSSGQNYASRDGFTSGGNAIDFLMNLPFIARERDEATKLLENSAAVRGDLLSGASIDEARNRIQELTRGQFGNAIQLLFSAAGLGRAGTQDAAQATASKTQSLVDYELRKGDIRASSFQRVGDFFDEAAESIGALAGMGGFGGVPTAGISGGGGTAAGGPINLLPNTPPPRTVGSGTGGLY